MNRGRGYTNGRPPAGSHYRGGESSGGNRSNAPPTGPFRGGSTPSPGNRYAPGRGGPHQRGSPNQFAPPRSQARAPPSTGGSSQDKAWNVVQRPRVNRRPPPKFELKQEDNAGATAWRQRELPKAAVRIPEDLVIAFTEYYDIAQRYRVFLLREQVRAERGGGIPFAIWGELEAVKAAQAAIESWVAQHARSKMESGASNHPKVASLTPRLREMEGKYWERELKQQRYRQMPPLDQEFEAIGNFHWPVQEYRPEEILGSSYEALDFVRTSCSCYINFDKERGIFQVYGTEGNVKTALGAIRRTCFQVAAQQLPTVHLYLLRWQEDMMLFPNSVELQTYYSPTTIPPPTTDGSEPSYHPKGAGGGLKQIMNRSLEEAAETGMQEASKQIMATIRKLHFYRANIQLRVRLGTFLLVQYRKTATGSYDFEEYEDMTKQSRFTGRTTQEIGDWDVETRALSRLQTAEHLLTPLNAMVDKLSDVDRTFTAIFTFHDEAGTFRLTMKWIETPSPHTGVSYDTISRKWSKLDRDLKAPVSLLDLSMTDLSTGSAVHVDISTTTTIDEPRVPSHLTMFAKMVKFNREAAISMTANPEKIPVTHDGAFTTFSPAPSLRSLEQRVSYQYGLCDFDATVELTRFQHRTYSGRVFATPTASAEERVTTYEPRWELSLHREAWDTMFAENEQLVVGQGTGWSDFEEAWWPSSVCGTEMGGGFEQIVKRLGRLEGVLRGEEGLGGMRVG